MGCGKEMEQWVPTQYHGKMVPAICGQTSIHGTELLCDECIPPDATVFVRYSVFNYDGIYCERSDWCFITFEREVSDAAATKAVRNLMRITCYCEYDCCGHWTGYGHIVKKVGKRTYLCVGHYSPNY